MGWAQPIFFWRVGMTVNLGELLEKTLPPMGYELVDWEMSPKGRLVRVFIDKPAMGSEGAGSGVSVADCAKVSHGLARPLTKLADYARFAGEDVQLNLHEMTDGARRWKGTLRGIEGDRVLVET